jgi:hypothetical protein
LGKRSRLPRAASRAADFMNQSNVVAQEIEAHENFTSPLHSLNVGMLEVFMITNSYEFPKFKGEQHEFVHQ